MNIPKIILKKNEEHRIKDGHLWVFSNEIQKLEGVAYNGDVVNVCDCKGNHLGSGLFNKNSLIAVRLLGKLFNGKFEDYVKTSILNAHKYRQEIYPNRNSYRLVFGESDFLPGLIIDKYNDTYVLQIHSFGIQKNIKHVIEVLRDDLKAKNIFTHNEMYFRKMEGLPEEDTVYLGEQGIEIIDDSKIKYEIDFANSQKTGFYFDQCDNREFIEKIVKDKIVLDAFCNIGGFGLHAAYAGAKSVTFLDSSNIAIEQTKKNFERNKLNCSNEYIVKDVFDYLEDCNSKGIKFGVVMIDPPAFAKNKKFLATAIKGYEKLNRLALSIVDNNGYLVSSSCSHHLSEEKFLEIVNSASLKANKPIQQIYFNGASLDHPELPSMPETSYLKFGIFRVI